MKNWDWPDCSLEVIIIKNEVTTFRVECNSHFFVVLKNQSCVRDDKIPGRTSLSGAFKVDHRELQKDHAMLSN